MPKQVIYSDRSIFALDRDENEIPVGESGVDGPVKGPYFQDGVHIGWSKGQDVEIGVARYETSQEVTEKGFFTTVDRAGINRIIRALRQARDDAFGKDA